MRHALVAITLSLAAGCAAEMPVESSCEGDSCDETGQQAEPALDPNRVASLLFGEPPTLDPTETEAVLELVNQKTCDGDQKCLDAQCGEDLQCFAAAGHIFAATQTGRVSSGGLIRSVSGKGITYRSVADLWSVMVFGTRDAAGELDVLVEYAVDHGFAD